MKRALIWIACALLALRAASVSAHDIRPIYLQLDEIAPGQVSVLLKLPVFRDSGLSAAHPRFSPGCRQSAPSPPREGAETVVQSWQLKCDAGLRGQTVGIEGFSVLAPDALVLARFADGSEDHYVLTQSHPVAELQPSGQGAARGTSLAAYVPIGVEHILLGFDHLMFLLGLILVTWRAGAPARVLIATVTAFTLAHSLTLAASVLGGVSLPSATVETLIALSILMLAVELARSFERPQETPSGLTFRMPWLVAFVFGLLHGFGFASALQETGLPAGAQGLALLLFNVGVECGQLLFIGAVFVVYRLARACAPLPMPRVTAVLTWLLGGISATWVLDRARNIFFI
jgi:hypothetical protein